VAVRWLEKLELFLYKRAARIVTVTNSFRTTLTRRGVDGSKVHVVTNGVDMVRFGPRPKDTALLRELDMQGCFVAGYIGTHGMAHGLETLLHAMRRLQDRPDARKIQLLLLGDGARKVELQAESDRLGLNNVRFVDTVPKDQVTRYWSLLDVSIIHLRQTELFTTVIPSKLFECMGMGIPVLHGVAGESAEIVRDEGVGITFEPENVDALVEGLLVMHADDALRRALGQRAVAAARNYDRQALAMRMLAILRDTHVART
jgi:glycosyltransferase involved in cell wall biosynthesis